MSADLSPKLMVLRASLQTPRYRLLRFYGGPCPSSSLSQTPMRATRSHTRKPNPNHPKKSRPQPPAFLTHLPGPTDARSNAAMWQKRHAIGAIRFPACLCRLRAAVLTPYAQAWDGCGSLRRAAESGAYTDRAGRAPRKRPVCSATPGAPVGHPVPRGVSRRHGAGCLAAGSWTGLSGQFRYTWLQCCARAARPGEHTSAGLCIGAAGAAGAASADAPDTTAAAPAENTHGGPRDRRSCKLHGSGSSGGLEPSRGGAGGGPEPAYIKVARSRSHGPAAARGSGQSSDSESGSLHTAGLTRLLRLK
jgi:hypothetical protein